MQRLILLCVIFKPRNMGSDADSTPLKNHYTPSESSLPTYWRLNVYFLHVTPEAIPLLPLSKARGELCPVQ